MKGASTLKILYMKIHQNNFNQFIEHCINNDFQAVGLEAMNEILVKLFETNGYGVFKMPEDNFGRYLKIVKEGNSTLVFTHQKSQFSICKSRSYRYTNCFVCCSTSQNGTYNGDQNVQLHEGSQRIGGAIVCLFMG